MVTIKGHVTQTSEFCGGAMPSPEKLKVLSTPQALPQKTIYIKIGLANDPAKSVINKVTTDENGNFSVSLKSGMTYCFIEEWKSVPLNIPQNTEFMKWDHKCYTERYHKADYVLKVKTSRNAVVNINYHQPCFFKAYCGEYNGPLPP